jgi:hypothetical protein
MASKPVGGYAKSAEPTPPVTQAAEALAVPPATFEDQLAAAMQNSLLYTQSSRKPSVANFVPNDAMSLLCLRWMLARPERYKTNDLLISQIEFYCRQPGTVLHL